MFTRTKVVGAAVAVIAGVALGVYLLIPDRASGSAPGRLDDGAELLPQAGISLAAAIDAATAATDGPVDEVDLEYWQGTLVFNVDVGNDDVKVDAATGRVLGAESDD